MWRFHSLPWNQGNLFELKNRKKKERCFHQCLLLLHRNSKRKKYIHRCNHIQSFNKCSIFSFKSLFMSLILEVSQNWFVISIQGNSVDWYFRNQGLLSFSFLLRLRFGLWNYAYHTIWLKIKWKKNRTKKGCGSFWTSFWVYLKKKNKDIDEDKSQAYCNLCYPYVSAFFSQKKNNVALLLITVCYKLREMSY